MFCRRAATKKSPCAAARPWKLISRCSHCGSEMQIIAWVEQPEVIL
jgi:hypothetical protein